MKKNDVIQTILAEMRAQKAEQDAAREAAYFAALKDTKFAEADLAVRSAITMLGKEKALGRKNISLEKKLSDAAALRNKLFAKYFIPPKTDFCLKCENKGYVKNKLCGCVLKKYSQKLSDISGIPQNTPKDFNADLALVFKDKQTQDEMKKVYSKLAQYCEKFPNVKTPNIMLSGATGTGKTFASQIVAANLLERDFSVLYMTAFSLIQRFKNYIFNFEKTENLDALFNCDFLVIDDLGTEPTIKNITQEYLYNVINERITNGKAFLITTNLSPDAIASRYDQRLASRILSAQTTAIIELTGKDLRLSK